MTDRYERMHDDRLRRAKMDSEDALKQEGIYANNFKEKIPPGTEVWENSSHIMSGKTIGEKGIYKDSHDLYVWANHLMVDGVKLGDPKTNINSQPLLLNQ